MGRLNQEEKGILRKLIRLKKSSLDRPLYLDVFLKEYFFGHHYNKSLILDPLKNKAYLSINSIDKKKREDELDKTNRLIKLFMKLEEKGLVRLHYRHGHKTESLGMMYDSSELLELEPIFADFINKNVGCFVLLTKPLIGKPLIVIDKGSDLLSRSNVFLFSMIFLSTLTFVTFVYVLIDLYFFLSSGSIN